MGKVGNLLATAISDADADAARLFSPPFLFRWFRAARCIFAGHKYKKKRKKTRGDNRAGRDLLHMSSRICQSSAVPLLAAATFLSPALDAPLPPLTLVAVERHLFPGTKRYESSAWMLGECFLADTESGYNTDTRRSARIVYFDNSF